jgi:hypothetical protein
MTSRFAFLPFAVLTLGLLSSFGGLPPANEHRPTALEDTIRDRSRVTIIIKGDTLVLQGLDHLDARIERRLEEVERMLAERERRLSERSDDLARRQERLAEMERRRGEDLERQRERLAGAERELALRLERLDTLRQDWQSRGDRIRFFHHLDGDSLEVAIGRMMRSLPDTLRMPWFGVEGMVSMQWPADSVRAFMYRLPDGGRWPADSVRAFMYRFRDGDRWPADSVRAFMYRFRDGDRWPADSVHAFMYRLPDGDRWPADSVRAFMYRFRDGDRWPADSVRAFLHRLHDGDTWQGAPGRVPGTVRFFRDFSIPGRPEYMPADSVRHWLRRFEESMTDSVRVTRPRSGETVIIIP